MTVVFGCPACGAGIELEPGSSGLCPRCGEKASLPAGGERVEACLACGGEELYRNRDFNPKVGIAIVALGAALCLVLTSFWPLVVAALIDGALYITIPDVGICYRCKAHHRDFQNIKELPAFDLERHEHYRFARAREAKHETDRE